jgi:hypothetical protein
MIAITIIMTAITTIITITERRKQAAIAACFRHGCVGKVLREYGRRLERQRADGLSLHQ